jgi:hypothetical protein
MMGRRVAGSWQLGDTKAPVVSSDVIRGTTNSATALVDGPKSVICFSSTN